MKPTSMERVCLYCFREFSNRMPLFVHNIKREETVKFTVNNLQLPPPLVLEYTLDTNQLEQANGFKPEPIKQKAAYIQKCILTTNI